MDFQLPNDAARAHFFSTQVVPLLERLNIPPEEQETLNKGLRLTKKRWDKYPDFNPAQRKEELSELFSRLARNAKLASGDEGLHRHNDIVVEIVHSILDLTKHLYMVGVEFGQELDAIHEVLCAVGHLIPKLRLFAPSGTNRCTCVVDSLRVNHSFSRTDGEVLETFTGPSSFVMQQAMLCLWRDMILGHLSKPENKMDTSLFVTSRLPSLLLDITRNPGVLVTLSTARYLMDPDDVTPGDEDPTEYDTYFDQDDEDEGESDDDWDDDEHTDDDMPPLTDASGAHSDRDSDSDGPPPLEPIAFSGRANRKGPQEPVHEPSPTVAPTISSKSIGLVTLKGSRPTSPISKGDQDKIDSKRADCGEKEDQEGSDESDDDTDDAGDEGEDKDDSSSDLGRELDEEDNQRLAQRPRLQKLIDLWTFKSFLAKPSEDGYDALRQIWNSRRPGLPTKPEILELLVAMHHSSESFTDAARIFVTEQATARLQQLVHKNSHLHSRASLAMRNIVTYFAGDPHARSRVEPLLYAAMKGIIQDMVLEVEWAFRGLTADKCEEYSTIVKKPAAQRAALLAIWVNSLSSPKAEAFSEEAQANTGTPQPFLMDPFGVFAALGINIGAQMPDPLMIDPIEALDDFTPEDADYDPLVNRYRPNLSREFEQWQSVATQVGDRDRASLLTPRKLFLDLMKIAPWISNKTAVKALISKCDSGRQGNIDEMLTVLNRFAMAESQNVKKALATKKAKAKSNAAPVARPAVSIPSATGPAVTSPTASVPPSHNTTISPIFGLTVPASVLGLPPMTGTASSGFEWATMPSSFNDVD